tara:strand:- start:1081 stop:2541 length:1461 start_codon:yes stop_codon:yes gene_type:complete
MFGLILGAILQILDTTMAAVALRNIQGALSASLDEITWVLTAYLFGVAVVMPLIGTLITRFGRRRVYLTAIIGFSIAATFSGLSNSHIELVLFRFMQGMFAATFVPVAQSFVFNTYSLEEQGQGIGVLTLGTIAGSVLGPALGGYLSEFHSWRWVFLLNVPLGLVSFLIIFYLAPKTFKRRGEQPFGLIGYLILVVSLIAFQFIFSQGENMDWFSSPSIVTAAGLASVTFYLFAAHNITSRRPFIAPRIFADKNFCIGLVLIVFLGAHWLVYLTLISQYLQILARYPAFVAGLALVPQGVAYALSSYLAGKCYSRFNPTYLIVFGFLAVGLANWQLSYLMPDFSYLNFYLAGIVHGIGLGFIFVPVTLTTFSTLPLQFKDVGTGLFSLYRNFGSSLGASLVIAYLIRKTQKNYAILTEQATSVSEVLYRDYLFEACCSWVTFGPSIISTHVTRQAMILAYASDFRWLAVSTIFASLLALFIRMPQR